MEIPEFKKLRRAYGFDEVAIVPGAMTVNPDQTNVSLKIDKFTFTIPFLASSLDAVVSPAFAISLDKMGGLAVLNLEGIYTRHDDPDSIIKEITQAPQEKATSLLQKIYSTPIKENLIGKMVETIKNCGANCAISLTPANTKRLAPIAVEAGADLLFIQSTVTTARHISKSETGLNISDICSTVKIPVVVLPEIAVNPGV